MAGGQDEKDEKRREEAANTKAPRIAPRGLYPVIGLLVFLVPTLGGQKDQVSQMPALISGATAATFSGLSAKLAST